LAELLKGQEVRQRGSRVECAGGQAARPTLCKCRLRIGSHVGVSPTIPFTMAQPIHRLGGFSFAALALLFTVGCGHPAQRALEGRWFGDTVENFDPTETALATGWARGA